MKRLQLLILLTLVSIESFAQMKQWTGDTTFWYKLRKEVNSKIGLEEIIDSKSTLSVRFSTGNTILDLHSTTDGEFEGQQVYFTSDYDQKEQKNGEFYTKKVTLSKDTARLAFNLFREYNILEMPLQDSINGWKSGFDGTTYIFEFSTPVEYSFKEYWTPSAFKEIGEAILMSEFISKIDVLLHRKWEMELFFRSLPDDKCYRYGDMMLRCPIRKEKKRSRK